MMLDEPSDNTRVKLLLIGYPKAGKTHYAAQAAAAGFNVLYIDGDVARPTLNLLPIEARRRIYYLDVADRIIDGRYEHRFADFVAAFCTTGKFVWNESRGEPFARARFDSDNDRVSIIRPSHIGTDTVVVFDSWSSYSTSVMQWKANELGVDLGEVEKFARDLYSGVGNKLNQTLQLIQSFRCHVIVIAHADEYQKLRKPVGVTVNNAKEGDMILDGVVAIPRSSSRPHSLSMGKHFSDIGWLEMKGSNRKMNFMPSQDRMAGGHFAEKNLDAESGSFANLVKMVGGQVPTDASMDSWLERFGPGEYVLPGAKPVVLGSGAPAPAKVGGLGGLMAKKGIS